MKTKKNISLLLLYELLESGEVLLESVATLKCGAIGGVRLAADETLLAGDITQLLEGTRMRGEITVGELEPLLEGGEVDGIVDHQHRHDSQSGAALESLVQT